MMWKYFVFVDESWTARQDPFFGLGCLIIPQEKIWEYNSILQRAHDFTVAKIKENENELLNKLTDSEKLKFLWNRWFPYEMKFRNINKTTVEWYKRMISSYFKFNDAKFCCLLIDRSKYAFPDNMNYVDAYLNQLSMLLKNNFNEKDIFVVLPDSITVSSDRNYEQELTEKLESLWRQCFWVCRIESHSSVFLQAVDCLIWAVMYDNRWLTNEYKGIITDQVKEKIWVSDFKSNFTKHTPNYFSVWHYHSK